uniref:Uncharacterized protein n=1 Tax=Arundo donax TaxID=35708 RepID=A0A0A8XX32_ARUDO
MQTGRFMQETGAPGCSTSRCGRRTSTAARSGTPCCGSPRRTTSPSCSSCVPYRPAPACCPPTSWAVAPPPKGQEAGDLAYMRAHFDRVVGSRDSESFYMLNPDGNNGPELSIFFIRI